MFYFTSDQHYGHGKIITHSHRPFADVHEMNHAILKRYNDVVGDNDTVFHIGDFCLDERLVKKVVPMLKGKKKLIPGNHDRCHSCHRNYSEKIKYYEKCGFEVLPERVVLDLSFGRVMLCHMPLRHHTTMDVRYLEHRPWECELRLEGCAYLLHGHVHELWKRKGNAINVGVDQWNFTPVSERELREFIL